MVIMLNGQHGGADVTIHAVNEESVPYTVTWEQH